MFGTHQLKPICLFLGILVPLWASSAAAQDEYGQAPDIHTLEELPESELPKGIPIELRVRSDTRFIVGSDFGPADANLYWPRGSVRIGVPLSKRAAVRFRINGGAAIYDFDGATNFFDLGPSSANPFDNLYSGAFSVEGAYRINEKWGLYAQGFTGASWEDGADFDDSISGGGGLAVGYHIPDRLALILGVALKSRLDRSGPRPYPLIDLEWMINENWKLRSHGLGATLEYKINDELKVFVRGRVEARRYRLDDRPGRANRGTVRDRQIPVGVGLRWVANRHMRIGAVAGVMAYHQLKVRDTNRDTIESLSAKPAPYFELRIDLRP